MKTYIGLFARMDAADTYIVMALKLLLALLFSVETLITAELINSIIQSLSEKSAASFSVYAAGVAGFWLLERAFAYLENEYSARLKKASETYLERHFIEKKSAISYEEFEKVEIQELINRVTGNADEKFRGFFENAIYLLGIALKITGLLCLLAYKNMVAGMVLLLLILLYFYLSAKSGKENYDAFEESGEKFRRADYYKSVMNDRRCAAERTLFDAGDYFCKKWFATFEEGMQIELRALWKLFFRTEAGNTVATVFVGLIAGILVLTMSGGYITIGFLIAFIKSMAGFMDTVSRDLSQKVSAYVEGVRFLKDYEAFEAIPRDAAKEEGKTEILAVTDITFRDVCFSYPGCREKILEHLSFTLDNSRHYALVGENGSGKSTILKLLMGFYEDYTGEILINGINIREISKENLRRLFSYVPQEVTRYEVRLDEYLGCKDGGRKQEILETLGLTLPSDSSNPLLGKIEEEGIDLSGGQWQLLAIARAMLEKREVYILDEPTAAIDPVREAQVYRIFNALMKQKPALMITHRLGAARMVDRIIVLKNGRVWEMGSHEQLMKKKEVYYQMFETQKQWYTADGGEKRCETI